MSSKIRLIKKSNSVLVKKVLVLYNLKRNNVLVLLAWSKARAIAAPTESVGFFGVFRVPAAEGVRNIGKMCEKSLFFMRDLKKYFTYAKPL